jgi:ParB family transcriptional regulator, chromosome partitioning protein
VSDKRIESRRVEDLKSHPRQAELFSDLNEAEFERLKQSLSKGLNAPIKITDDDTVIDGHQRLRAARELGWQEIQVWVGDDLPNQQAIDQRHIEANLDRRQLNRIEQARLIRELCDLERKNRPRRHHAFLGDVRDRIGRRFGMDGRTAQRWMNILETPREVQDAVSQGKLTMLLAEQVSRLTHEQKKHVTDRIRDGEDPVQVVRDTLTQKRKPERQSEGSRKPVDGLELIAMLLDRVEIVDSDLSDEDTKRSLDALARCSKRCRALTSQLKRPTMAADANAGNCQSEYSNLGAL